MARINILLPAMGEGVIEATVNKWLVSEGSVVGEDDPIVEVATDKVDSEVPSPVKGTIVSIVAGEGSVTKVGDILAIIESEIIQTKEDSEKVEKEVERIRETIDSTKKEEVETESLSHGMKSRTPSGKFISPLVRSIAASEGISYSDLDKTKGTGMDGRITKDDILNLISKRKKETDGSGSAETIGSAGNEKEVTEAAEEEVTEEEVTEAAEIKEVKEVKEVKKVKEVKEPKTIIADDSQLRGDEIIPMDRIRKLIADHMVMSKRTSPHVTSFIDADVTKLVNWRNANKEKFQAAEGQKLTLTPFFIDAAARALYEFPMVNITVDGTNIIRKKNINIGMATALPDGNLIVPVIKNANEKNLTGLAKAVNELAERARNNKLKPDEITGGTFTITNFGSYNNLAGTPIINQPQAAILGTGAVRKTPAVIETPDGDMIAIRQIMILSLSYDHRVIDGALAGKFLHKVKEILENYSPDIS
jgi:2-oxoglutarate dehydrogenase E2 component (dihydrolipoamide succinyltransferase)